MTWDGYLFPRGANQQLLVHVLLGGAFDPDIAKLDSEEVVAIAEKEMRTLLGVSVAANYRRSRLWPKAIPQYELGHGARLESIETVLARTPGLFPRR